MAIKNHIVTGHILVSSVVDNTTQQVVKKARTHQLRVVYVEVTIQLILQDANSTKKKI